MVLWNPLVGWLVVLLAIENRASGKQWYVDDSPHLWGKLKSPNRQGR
jgi:hypothetical protein